MKNSSPPSSSTISKGGKVSASGSNDARTSMSDRRQSAK